MTFASAAAENFAAAVGDVDRHLSSANDANRARRAELLQHLTGGAILGHFTDVSPLLRGGSGAPHYDPYAGPHTYPAAPSPYHAAHRGLGSVIPPVLTTSEAVDRQVQEAVSKALRGHEDRVAEIVARDWDRRSQELEHALRGRFTDLQVLNESTGRLLRDVGAAVSTLKSDMVANNERLEATIANLAAELRTRIADVTRSTNREVMTLRENVLELQSRFAVDTAEFSRRIDAAQRRATESYAEVLAVVDQRVAQVRTDSETSSRETTRKMQTEIDAALRIAQDSHAIVARGDAELRRLGAKTAEIHEDAAIRRSELRTLHADVQQLELYMKGRIDKIAAAANRGATVGGGAGTVNAIEMDRVQRDVYALQQGLTYVSNKLRSYGFLDEDDEPEEAQPAVLRPAALQRSQVGLGDSAQSRRGDTAQPFVVSDLTSQPGSTRKATATFTEISRSHFQNQSQRQNSAEVSPRRGATGKRRYSQTADPFLHSAQSFDVGQNNDNGAEDEDPLDAHDSDDSNRRLANSQID